MFKILVAEDDAELRQLFCRVLTRHGFQPIGAADGVEALQVLERDYIDLIVSDIMMPQLDGYALVRGLRDSGSTIPVLMITARDGFQDMQFGFLAGADDYLVKPINVNELVLRINALLRRAQMVADRRQTLGTTTFEFDSFSVLTGGVQTVLLAGTTTPNCIRTTCYDAISLDYDAVVLSDCTSSVTDAVQAGNLADMQRVGATVCASTELTLA